jgi:hypothetical protein
MEWPKCGVYFYRETGEMRADTGDGPRVVRIGTHALKTGGTTKLWDRLSAHKRAEQGWWQSLWFNLSVDRRERRDQS